MSQQKNRQLMTVMFTDIVGYTALMQTDEERAAKLRARHRAVFRGMHALYGGQVIQYFGDGTLSVFKSAVAAAQCAIEIQNRLQANDPVPLRIGLHMGEIVFDETEIYGDAVNVASRIESLGSVASILISGKVNDELRNHPAISTSKLGACQLKNVSEQVEIFAISNTGINVPLPFQNRRVVANENSIAVMPFINLSSKHNSDCIGEGIGEEVINALQEVKGINLKSRTSSYSFKRQQISLLEIGRALNVSMIVQGSVRKYGNNVRVSAQLIEAVTDRQVWSNSWNRSLNDVLNLQDELAKEIVKGISDYLLSQQSTDEKSPVMKIEANIPRAEFRIGA